MQTRNLGLGILALCGLLLVGPGCREGREEQIEFTADEFTKIAKGVTEQEAKRTLGKPQESLEVMGSRYLYWIVGVKCYSVTFDEEGKAEEMIGPCDLDKCTAMKAQVKELSQLEGTWDVVSVERDGIASCVDVGMGERYHFLVKDRVLIRANKRDLTASSMPYSLSFGTSPKEISFPSKGEVGIYEIKGGEFKICIQTDREKKGSPSGFETSKGSGLVTWRFEKAQSGN